jgi:hypothetical protein
MPYRHLAFLGAGLKLALHEPSPTTNVFLLACAAFRPYESAS